MVRGKHFFRQLLIAFLMITLVLIPALPDAPAKGGENAQAMQTQKIVAFERCNPVYSINVYKGTDFAGLGLPDTLRVIEEVDQQEAATFVQQQPQADANGDYDFYSYGYVAPADEELLREKDEPVIYTLTYGDGSKGYRVYGALQDKEPSFFVCDESGSITGRVAELPVTWNEAGYDEQLYDTEQRLVPEWSENISYEGAEVYASITVLDMTEEEANEQAAAEESREKEKALQAAPPAKAPRAAGDKTYQQALADIKKYTTTSGSKPGGGRYGTGVPGSWKDYVNTIWMNKALPQFKFAASGVEDKWKWNGKTASKASGDPQTDPDVMPKARLTTDGGDSCTKYQVYSVQQLRYALNASDSRPLIVIEIMQDLDFNGSKYNWEEVTIPTRRSLTIYGNDHVLYNLCSYTGMESYPDASGNTNVRIRGRFLNLYTRGYSLSVNDLEFNSAFCATFNVSGGGIFGYNSDYAEHRCYGTMDNVVISNSLFYNGGEAKAAMENEAGYYDRGKHIAPFGSFGSKDKAKISACAVIDSYVYGADHVSGLINRAQLGVIAKNCFVSGTLLCGTGGHSAGFISCQADEQNSDIDNCFTNIEMYGSKQVCGFTLLPWGTFDNCFSTGKIEGYQTLSGFAGQHGGSLTLNNCYSTCLVGMRSEAVTLSGFVHGGNNSLTATNCYAAGEVGNHTTDIRPEISSTTAGGFSYTMRNATFTNCYYDKQTTAMREWASASVNTQKDQTLAGVTGVLTTDTEKAGNGLASVPQAGDSGFTGFSSNQWYYEEGLYPQLKNMQNAQAADWGGQEQANLARANSLVSVSTVYLDTWDEGYDWNSYGVRSKAEVSYDRTPEEAFTQAQKAADGGDKDLTHLGSEYTYDTVRSIVNDFSSTEGANYHYAIQNGAGAVTELENWKTGEQESLQGAFTGGEGSSSWTIVHPGMEWITIERTDPTTATRPLRLIAYMDVYAGEDQTIAVDSLYDHRQDVELTIMDSLSNDLVVGLDDKKTWATAALQGYPGYQAALGSDSFGQVVDKNGANAGWLQGHYYEVPTVATGFSSSIDAWVYTEIWLTKIDGEPLKEPQSVKVTGAGTNGPTLTATEEQWMGGLPIGMGMHEGMTFEISYYWMLSDGRYHADSKKITLTPGTYDLREEVYNEDGTENSTALRLGTTDGDIAVGDKTAQNSQLLTQDWGKDVLAAWEADNPSVADVIGLELEYSSAGMVLSSDPADNTKQPYIAKPRPGDKITIRVPYYGYRLEEETNTPDGGKYDRIVLEYEPLYVDLTYEVRETTEQGRNIHYLSFDKAAVWDANQQTTVDLAAQGIELNGDAFANMIVNDIEFDIKVTLTVAGGFDLDITKTDGADNSLLAGVRFMLYEADNDGKLTLDKVKQLSAAQGVKVNGQTALTEDGALTSDKGVLSFSGLATNKYYYLVETEPLAGYVDMNGMLRIYRAGDGTITMTALDADGSEAASPVLTDPDMDGGRVYISSAIKNYQGVPMPDSSGGGKEIFFALAATMLALALCLLLQRNRTARKL